MLNKVNKCLSAVKKNTPLVHIITNYVTVNDCANILLSFGASPAMVESREETEEFVELAASFYINLGTLTEEQWDAALLAASRAGELKKPVILDPVAAGAISRKTRFVERLFEIGHAAVIKGNLGEIKSLAGFQGKMRGVDSVDDGSDAIEACRVLAKKYNTIAAATGETDIVSDGERTCLVYNGTSMFTKITGAGCMAGALVAATVGASDDPFTATVAGIMALGLAGEKAAASMPTVLPGTFRTKLFDSMYSLSEEEVLKGGKIRCL
ncbi:MAG: hydroxyethylthiazole kinase [Syntrophomonadaceae bacterium]